jgi:hypothetical protein
MPNNDSLLPPLPLIRDRLTRNQRERSLLRALFRLAVRAKKELTHDNAHEPRHEAAGRECGHEG